MAHNPPRPYGLDPAAVKRLADEVASRPAPPWGDLAELADRIEAKAKAGKKVVLTPNTALVIAQALRRLP